MFEALRREVGKVIVGHEEIVDDVLISLFSGGHVLLEGVPGLGKTLLVRTLSSALSLEFRRIQFTPDLMPADIIGTNIVMEDQATGRREFQFQHGPIFGQIILADEINRATPKTQSAMLEAMQEHSVTSGGQVRKLPEPFMVLATQNPIEQEGTYPLPEAQLDRFFFKLLVRLQQPRAAQGDPGPHDDRRRSRRPSPSPTPRRSSGPRSWSGGSSSPSTCRTTRFGWSWRRTRRASSRRT